MKRIHAKVIGKVQGVYYRASTKDVASNLQLTGWVMNMPDGSVELEAQGPTDKIDELISWLHEGPPYARVDEVIIKEIPLKQDESEFKVRWY